MPKAQRRGSKAVLCLWALKFFASSVAGAQSADRAVLTLPNMPLHDPWILANGADKTYYLYTSNVPSMSGVQGAGTMVYRSRDLK